MREAGMTKIIEKEHCRSLFDERIRTVKRAGWPVEFGSNPDGSADESNERKVLHLHSTAGNGGASHGLGGMSPPPQNVA